MRVLFLGNSFTSGFDLPKQIQAVLAAHFGKECECAAVCAGGAALAQWRNDKDGAVARAVKGCGGRFDYVVLQEQSNKPWKNKAKYEEAVKGLHEVAGGLQAETVLYQTTPWKAWVGAEEESALLENVEAAAAALQGGCAVAPVGRAAQLLRSAHPAIPQWEKDGRHPSCAVVFLAACVFAGVLAGDPAGVARVTFPLEALPPKARRAAPSEEDARRIAGIAAAALQQMGRKRAASEDAEAPGEKKRRRK
eukprot:TRINITY_DN419_c1_g2_i1.p2 TRINITY_DN419_c1_g2~~TRINITY_DN419_c1_g2_i1.p2  ORF type:complete len:250 (+),score=114.73 TRINITY_DN419_c1_g2_i1:2-751(+)